VLSRVNLNGIGEILEGYDGTSAWVVNPIQGARVKQGRELQQSKRSYKFDRDLDWASEFDKVSVRGIEKVNGKDAYVVVGSLSGMPEDVLYFDVASGLLVRSDSTAIAPEAEQKVSSTFDDYRAVDGILIPHKVVTKTPQFEIHTSITETKHDVPMEDKIFVQPN
jgi:hypothetical protein